jgi:hypothetical protein
MNNLLLAPNFSIPAVDYAGQGNAILGIRDAGKTYTAMKAAEELLENKIPIVVYDPVGIWKNLKIGTGKNKGYPVVVAGGEGSDIRLTINNAVDIVRAAMKENVSLVIDLYSPELINKSTWIRIVQETVDLLMYENKSCGLRHIFIEEAAEFIPQRLQPQHSKVYASLERLARMGRNARLGYTLINQRAEEVNKAILEISAFSLLHKQVGKNSLKSIQTWMELLQVDNAKEIVHSLPTLKQGECWVIGMNTKPHRIKVSERKTFHPDPKQSGKDQVSASFAKVDVQSFVDKLNKQLEKPETSKTKPLPSSDQKRIDGLSQQLQKLAEENHQLKKEIDWHRDRDRKLVNIITQYKASFKLVRTSLEKEPLAETVSETFSPDDLPAFKPPKRHEIPELPGKIAAENFASSISGGTLRMLKVAAVYYPNPTTVQRIAAIAGLSHSSGTFGVYFRSLKRENLITVEGKSVTATQKGFHAAGNIDPLPTDPKEIVEMWCRNLGENSGMAKMLHVLFNHHPNYLTGEELGQEIGMSHTSGTFGVYQRKLRKLGLIEMRANHFKAADELFN